MQCTPDIVASFPDTKYIYSIIFRLDVVASRIQWPDRGGPRWPLCPKCTVHANVKVLLSFPRATIFKL